MLSEVRSPKQQLILTAERLYAVHGLDGVALRQIGIEAGMANKSAVQYHFGSKNGLVQAIIAHRVDDLDRRRELLLARVRPGDLRGIVEAHHLPLIELGEDEDCYYLQFIEQLERKVHPLREMPEVNRRVEQAYYSRTSHLLREIPESLRRIRIMQASATCLYVCADRHRSKTLGEDVPRYALHVSQLLDTLIAILTVAPSPETIAALDI
ncbi:helix-turn-helix domain-containing protein [Gordonia sp. CPCC 206044]|uniref:TetR/AcrR family transcriptional regulator n=1 Tax=Gordonia sp. CPCC 206044 TaxID=3140793 RepID=UPI003AF3F8E9